MSNHPRHAFANGRRTILGDVGVNRVCPEGLKPIQNQNPPCTFTAAAVAEDASYAVAEPPLYVRRHDPYLWHVVEFGYLCSMPLPGTQFPQVSIEDACDQLPPPYADLHDQSLNYTANVDWCNVSACTDSPAADATADLQHNASFDMPSWNDTSSASPVKRLAEVEPSRRPSPDGRRIVAPDEPAAKVAITKVADANVALVAFGVRATWYGIYGGSLQSAPAPGTYVVVPGDRGIDVGIVIEIARARGQLCSREWRQYLPAWRVPLAAPIAPAGLPRLHIMRRANNSEVSLCRTRRSDHTAAILRTQNAVNEFARRERSDSLLTMKVVAVEYQHDCGKVTIYFESPIASLRIADLAVNLFKSTFRCRVWLHQLESAPMLP